MDRGSIPLISTTSRQAFMAYRVFFIENTAALVRLPLLFPKKPIGFSGALFLFCKVRFASTFFFSKNVYACSLASPFPKKSCDFSGALPALCVWGGGGKRNRAGDRHTNVIT